MASLKCKEVLCLLYSVLLFISGVLLITFSVILFYRLLYHFTFVPGSTIGPFIVIFLLGFIHLALTWLAVKGPTREHDLHIILFMIITVVLLIVEFAVGVWGIVLWDEVDVHSDKIMFDSFKELLAHETNKKKWMSLESKLHCCGYNGAHEYTNTPESCCGNTMLNGSLTCDPFYKDGCKFPLIRHVKHLMIDASVMGFCCCALQAFGIFLFYKFFAELRRERTERYQRRLSNQRTIAEQPQYVVPVLPVSARSGVESVPPSANGEAAQELIKKPAPTENTEHTPPASA